MIRKFIRNSLIGLLLCCLSACALNDLMNSPAEQRQESLDTFVQAMRLGEFKVAASYLTQNNRAAFLNQFEALEKDLTFVETRVEEVTILDEGDKVDVVLELDYFLLPSATVKTFRFDHTWAYVEPGGNQVSGYLIETPFPSFP